MCLSLLLLGCAPRPDRTLAVKDVGRLFPRARIVHIGVGEGNDESAEWEVTVIDTAGREHRAALSYMYDKARGWYLYSVSRRR